MAELNNEVLYCWNSNISTCYTNIIQNPVTIFPYWYLVEYYLAQSGILQNSIQHILTVYILLSDTLFETEKQYFKVIVNLQVVLY
jgi:hypothetical protein